MSGTGRYAYRRVVEYLAKGRLYFKDNVRCMTINYDAVGKPSLGVR